MAAFFRPGTGRFRVIFDRALRTDPALNPGNWRATSGLATFWLGILVAARGSSVYGNFIPGLAGPPAGNLQYDPPPFDVFGRLGGVAAPFIIPWVLG